MRVVSASQVTEGGRRVSRGHFRIAEVVCVVAGEDDGCHAPSSCISNLETGQATIGIIAAGIKSGLLLFAGLVMATATVQMAVLTESGPLCTAFKIGRVGRLTAMVSEGEVLRRIAEVASRARAIGPERPT